MTYNIGIDIGSTTVKVVVLDENKTLLYHSYDRHYSKVREKALEQLSAVSNLLSGKRVRSCITGSAGLGVAKAGNMSFVQEVFATAAAVREYIPDTDAVIELGGEDAKIIFFAGALEERMNGSCAGGTGAFIDQMATLLNVTTAELDELSFGYKKIYPIASRCGVFAKSDIQPILNQGGRKEDIAASIYQAVVDQTVSGLTQGRELAGKIVFLGGPLTFLKGLRERFIETLSLDSQHAVFPENAECFAAIGAAICADNYPESDYDELLSRLEDTTSQSAVTAYMEPLFSSESEYEEFKARHAKATAPMADADTYSGPAYLGIDAGSTTTKLALITPEGKLLYTYYGSNMGSPVPIVRDQLSGIYEKFGSRVEIRGSAVTGYGEELIKNAFSVDLGLVETMAHYRAARFFDPSVDFIIDIGGQDMKCFKIRNGAVDSIMLNEACSSGCGSFIETFARALGYEIAEFAQLGIFDQRPVDLGSRCTVFMNSSVKQAQKEGATVEDISAGLSCSIVKNAVYKVIRAASADDLGQNIVVQGGTFLNDAVLRAFEREIGRNVTRPTIAGLMGAYGAALTAMDADKEVQVGDPGNRSSLLTHEQLKSFSHTSKPATCNLCTNHCSLTVNMFDGGRRYISGNRCSRPLGGKKSVLPNLMAYKYKKLRALGGRGKGSGIRGRVGIPFGLNMYENLPFWFEFWTKLNFEVVLSDESSRSLYRKGQHTIPSDTVCYPAKLMHGHIESLIEKGVDFIFYPCMPYNFDEKLGDNNYNCPVVAYYPELLGANIPSLRRVPYHAPYFGLHRPRDFSKRAQKWMLDTWNIPKKETKEAVRAAYEAYNAYRKDVENTSREYIELARREGRKILVAAGRPYHADPEINHGIDELVTGLGLVLITEDAISSQMGWESRKVLNQWTYQSRMYAAARWACLQPDAELVQLVSFGCGTDAITGDEMRDILEGGGKLYTQIKIDEITNLGAVRIRLRSLVAASEERGKGGLNG
ncbi:MAG: acyl-CoA dehydratase activase [Oscillospiraceae bacterium]|jgi:predicted CoA-substrate-specific enzyme activase